MKLQLLQITLLALILGACGSSKKINATSTSLQTVPEVTVVSVHSENLVQSLEQFFNGGAQVLYVEDSALSRKMLGMEHANVVKVSELEGFETIITLDNQDSLALRSGPAALPRFRNRQPPPRPVISRPDDDQFDGDADVYGGSGSTQRWRRNPNAGMQSIDDIGPETPNQPVAPRRAAVANMRAEDARGAVAEAQNSQRAQTLFQSMPATNVPLDKLSSTISSPSATVIPIVPNIQSGPGVPTIP